MKIITITSQSDIDKMIRDVWEQTSHFIIKCDDLSSLDFSGLEAMKELVFTVDVLGNSTGTLDLSSLTKNVESQFGLHRVSIKNEAIVFNKESNLELLLPDLSQFNDLTVVEIEGMLLPKTINWPPNLEELRLHQCSGLTHLKDIPETVERLESTRGTIGAVSLKNRMLHHLNLRGNPLIELVISEGCPLSLAINDTSLTNLEGVDRQVRHLEMSNTPIQTLKFKQNLGALEAIHASCSALQTLEGLEDCKYLKEVDISRTSIEDFTPLKSVSSLGILYLNDRKYSLDLREKLTGLHCHVCFSQIEIIPNPLLLGELTPWDLKTSPTDKGAEFVLSELGWKPIVKEFGTLIGEYNGHQLYKVEVRGWLRYVLQSGDRYREVESDDPQTALLS